MEEWWVIIYLRVDILPVIEIINEILDQLRGIRLMGLYCIFY
jgi:hypothetical protein